MYPGTCTVPGELFSLPGCHRMHSFLCGIRHGVLRDTELDQGSLDNEESGAREAEG